MATYDILNTGTRVCKKCNKELPITDFYINKRSPGGRDSTCKSCRLEYHKQYHMEHKQEDKEYKRQYYEENKEYVLKHNKEYRDANKDEINAKERERYATDHIYRAKALLSSKLSRENSSDEQKEKRKLYLQQWQIDNKEHIESYVKEHKEHINAVRRERYKQDTNTGKREHSIAMSRKSMTGWSQEEYAKALFDQKSCCYLCGIHISEASKGVLVADHDHETGIKRRLLCHSCNRGLGLFHDNPDVLEKAAAYIRDFKSKGQPKKQAEEQQNEQSKEQSNESSN